MIGASPSLLFVPGLRDEMPDHWQSILAARLPRATTVPRRTTDKLSCAAWVAALDECIARIQAPLVLVAHSGGTMMVAHWAARHRRPIAGALLATPPDFDLPLPEGYPTPQVLRDNGWLPVPRARLPFPSIVAASTNDPLCSYGSASRLAHDWGSALINVGAVGHLNPAAGYGPWPLGEELVCDLLTAVRVLNEPGAPGLAPSA